MENKKRTFLQVERLFKGEMRYYPAWLTGTFNICCDETEKRDIIEIGDRIKTIPEFESLSFRNIYLVLIYIYYSLNLNEQSTDWLNMKFLSDNVEYDEDDEYDEENEEYKTVKLCKKLYYDITTGDIMINNSNFSSDLRRKIMGMPMRAGRKTKRNRRKLNKTKKYKTKKYKTKRYKTKKYK
jgi:hypothetical protein